MNPIARVWLLGLAVVIATGERSAFAAPPEATTTAEAPVDPAMAEAEGLYEEGLICYETVDYDCAIERWQRAYGKARAIEGAGTVRNAIVYNIARAQEKAYAQDKDVLRLKKARDLMQRYIDDARLDGTEPADIDAAFARKSQLEQEIQRAEAASAKPIPRRPEDTAPRKQDRQVGLLAGGGVLIALGVGTIAGGVTAGVLTTQRAAGRIDQLGELGDEPERRDQLARAHLGDRVMVASAAVGGAAVAVGAALVAIGARRAKRNRVGGHAAFGPRFDPTSVGFAVRGAF